MKKIITILVVFISSIIFYDGYVNISQKQYNDVINIVYKVAKQQDMDVIPVDLQLSENKEERVEQFNKVYQFLEEYHYTCFVGMTSKNVNTEYIYAPKKDRIQIYTVENKSIDFSKSSTDYLSSSYNDKDRYATIDFIDSSYHENYNQVYRIKQFSNYIKDWNGNTLFPLYFVSNNKAQLLNDLQVANITNEMQVNGDISTSNFSLSTIDYSFLKRILMYLMIAILLCLLSDLLASRKEIFIRKMQGASSIFIYKKQYGSFYIFNILFYTIVQFVLYLSVVQNIRPVNSTLIIYLFKSILLFILCMGIVLSVSFFILCQIQSVSILKKTQFKWLSYTVAVLKAVFMVSIFVPLSISFTYTYQVVQDGYYLNKYETNYHNYLHLEGLNMNMFSNKFSDAIIELKQMVKKYPYIYEDFSTKIGMDGEEIGYPYVFVNKEYLKEYPLYKDGKKIKNVQSGTIYVPKSVSVNENYCLASQCEYESIDDGNVMASHSVSDASFYVKNPIIYVIDDDYEMDLFHVFIKDEDGNVKENIDKYLKSNGLYENVNFTYENDNYNKKLSLIQKLVIDSSILLFVYVLVLFLFQYQAIHLYFLQNQKVISLNCLLGKGIWGKYKSFILLDLIIYLILLIASKNVLFILLAMIVDVLTGLFFKSQFEKKKVLFALKGEI